MFRLLNIIIVLFFCSPILAETTTEKVTDAQEVVALPGQITTMSMLSSLIELRQGLNERITGKKKKLAKSSSEAEQENLRAELHKLYLQLEGASIDFERIATGIDIGLFGEKKEKLFNWQDEMLSLVKPGIKELKRLTIKLQQKSKIKDDITYYESLIPIAATAIANIMNRAEQADVKKLKKELQELLPEWRSVEEQIQSKLQVARLQLEQIEHEKKSMVTTFRESIKQFFRTRGLYLIVAIGSCLGIVLLFRLLYRIIVKIIPGYQAELRPFSVRVLDIIFRLTTLLCTIAGLMLVFYLAEDWVLLSMTVVFLLGVGWATKNTLPQFWQQSRLMLNIGAVREGERIVLHGVPWQVKNINLFSILLNPCLDVKLRLPIEELIGKISRPSQPHEPWFPCKKNDWVILSDSTRGKVVNLSHEMVELVQRGGAHKTYQTQDFLTLAPQNISVNFRIKIPFGISYDLQKQVTSSVIQTLEAFIMERIEQEGYKDTLLNLRVEFLQAGSSSLDLLVITDFQGKMAPLYNRISRAIQKWCVDACTTNNWDIPFPQLTLHRTDATHAVNVGDETD